jgi:hypothetical protein
MSRTRKNDPEAEVAVELPEQAPAAELADAELTAAAALADAADKTVTADQADADDAEDDDEADAVAFAPGFAEQADGDGAA